MSKIRRVPRVVSSTSANVCGHSIGQVIRRNCWNRLAPSRMACSVQTTGLYYNKALLDQASLEPPKTIADFKAMVAPLAALGAAPLVHCSGDVSFNTLLVTWVLPMIAERTGDPLGFVESTIKGEVGYDSREWTEAFRIIVERSIQCACAPCRSIRP